MRLLCLFVSLTILIRWLPVSTAAAKENACLACHSRLGQKTTGGMAYLDWKDSVHDQAGVTCDRCHGGNPDKPDRDGAHRGVLGPADPASRVHYSRIPALCGGCHQPQLKEFKQSRHYQVFLSGQGTVRGPTCITCHGSMHTTILAPHNVAETCRRCHNAESGISPNVPEEAHATLDLIFYAKNTVKWSQEFVRMARKQGFPVTKAAAALKNAEEKFHLSEVRWHTFDFHEILTLVDESYESAKKAKHLADEEVTRGALKKISGQPKPPRQDPGVPPK